MALRSSKLKFTLAALAILVQFYLLGEASPLDLLRELDLNFVLVALALVFVVPAGMMAIKAAHGDLFHKAKYYTWTFVFGLNSLHCLMTMAGGQQRQTLANFGSAGLFLLGLCWLVWYVDSINRPREHSQQEGFVENVTLAQANVRHARIWDPLDIRAWFYGHNNNNKLNQSVTILLAYSLLFMALGILASAFKISAGDAYEMPGGGGGGGGGGAEQLVAFKQQVQVKKVVRKKFIINPYSSINFTPPEIDNVALNIDVVTEHLYKAGAGKGGAGMGKGSGIGWGDGDGDGFGPGTAKGKVRFIRLEYPGGDWNQDFGVGADLNMLIEYGVRTRHKVNDQTESRTIGQLGAFEPKKSPPLVYLTGQKNITLSKGDIRILREYLLDNHGMIFADNGGSQHFGGQVWGMMSQILPEVQPVKVPLDDVIHSVPYPLPFLPIVAPHGGREAWGWKVDGRWVCYYHPGDIGDAWSDGHSGVPRSIYEACYQLGTNVIFYAHVEYSKWLVSQQGKK